MTKAIEKTATLRCAIYTRKSSEEGLDQSFNSLHAQREACEAYIKSQTHEGWMCLSQAYDDGGFSGGSMERPGLKALLDDISRGRVDVVVVYKVDRLTRSLTDFSRIVDAFDGKGVSFVSVTQAFNTTTSMGRLTLNVLLSFAQFEREVTGERIRDKIAQSKAKGMWMGGNLPLGYDTRDRTLVINEIEAEQVRHVFNRYLELGSVDALTLELRQAGYRSKVRINPRGVSTGGAPFSRGAIYHLLQNRLYRGEIPHKDKVYPGLHAAIVDTAMFDAVQRALESNRIRRRKASAHAAVAKLTGKVFWADGTPMSPSFAYGRGERAYRYYTAGAPTGDSDGDGPPRRIPAEALETYVLEALRRLSGRPGDDWAMLEPALVRLEPRPSETHLIISPEVLLAGEHPDTALAAIRTRLRQGEQVLIEPGKGRSIRFATPLRMSFRGGRTWLMDQAGLAAGEVQPNTTLIAALKQAHKIMDREGLTITLRGAPSAIRAPASPYHRKLCRLALLSPEIQRTILDGRAPASLTLQDIVREAPPILWADQPAWLARICRN